MTNELPRLHIMQRLREELLGPKGGREETLETATDPREEYTTGVLDMAQATTTTDDEIELLEASEVEIPRELEGNPDDEEPEDPLLIAADFAPQVDPRRLPCSIGLTCFVRAPEGGGIDVCISGGRYRKTKEHWQRTSYVFTRALKAPEWEGEHLDAVSGMKLVVRSRAARGGLVRLSLYLVNAECWEGMTGERASRFLYQPQIRVCLTGSTQLQTMADGQAGDQPDEEQRMQMLYRRLPILARGHMCAAVWRAIDVEQCEDSPFRWVDQCTDAQRFSRCDLRTEFLPAITVPTPYADWRDELGPPPEQSALKLSELSQSELGKALTPLTAAYERWIESIEGELETLAPAYHALGREHIALCRQSLARIGDGIALVARDQQAYLAFCFANRAVHEQASWSAGRELRWRPFQLGFILQCLPGLADPSSDERDICDLLWFPTGGGKTEAYLGLTAFVLGMRRLRSNGYDGVGVISRYTLRLLSIQQFRRALKLVTACEMLRVESVGEVRGWRPEGCGEDRDWLWGRHRFSAGLWLGSSVTPNQLEGNSYKNVPGAFELLRESKAADSEPAQVTDCPVCSTVLAVPAASGDGGVIEMTLHLRVTGFDAVPPLEELSTAYVEVLSVHTQRVNDTVHNLCFKLRSKEGALNVDDWWGIRERLFGENCRNLSVRAERPGYFIEGALSTKGKPTEQRIEIYCPNPDCRTAKNTWCETLPLSTDGRAGVTQSVPEAFAVNASGERGVATQCPIPALTVDDLIYAWPPSLLISTVDKFARLAYESRAASLFGNVEYYHAHEGFYREGCFRARGGKKSATPHPPHQKLRVPVSHFPPPDLVIQDELHLIDGPLGSMVGLYETAVSRLCGPHHRLKYVASTATVREAGDQVQSLFARRLQQFPPSGLDAMDSFFAHMRPSSLTQESGSGRLYMAYSAPGRGALTPQVRAWAVLLQAVEELRWQGVSEEVLDPYWSPVGYFTTIRSLAATASLWRQAIRLRLEYLGREQKREINDPVELSSRVLSSKLPGILGKLSLCMPQAVDGVLSTSMFGTGVDVSRLSLMLVQGQPKTTSSYIQATGRVGRQSPALVLALLPATNPRALDHFEFFTGYHQHLYRGVEPVTVFPFAPRARERALGPLCVALLRQLKDVGREWRDRSEGARLMATAWQRQEVRELLDVFVARATEQPELRRPTDGVVADEVQQAILNWKQAAELNDDLLLDENTMAKRPEHPVVLGDPQHAASDYQVVYHNAPQSLREIEPTTGFKI